MDKPRTITVDGQEIELAPHGQRIERDGMVIYNYGVTVIGQPARDHSCQNWQRVDIFVDTAGQRFTSLVWCDGPNDKTPPVSTYQYQGKTYATYDGDRCPCCYLNFGHTHAHHDRAVHEHAQRRERYGLPVA